MRILPDSIKKTGGEGIRTIVVTILSFATGFLLTIFGTEVVGLQPELSYSISIIFCTICNFFAYRHYIFRSSGSPLLLEALKFFPMFLVFRTFEIFLFSFVSKLGMDYRLAYVATALTSASLKFLAAKFLVFKAPSKPGA